MKTEPTGSLERRAPAEVSLYTGIDFHLQNQDMDYTSGTSLHLDLTVAQHLPLLGGFLGVGANAFYYQQLTGDVWFKVGFLF